MRADAVSLVAGVAIVALGSVLVLDQTGVASLDFGWLGAAIAAVAGVVLLVSGLVDRDG